MDALALDLAFPPGWNVKSRCAPDPFEVEKTVKDAFGKSTERLRKRYAPKQGSSATTSPAPPVIPDFEWDARDLHRAVEGWCRTHPRTPSEALIEEIRIRRKYHLLACTPMDKYAADAMLM